MRKDKAIVKVSAPQGERPVRVKLRRIHAGRGKPYPPDGNGKIWWSRLQAALGTRSSDFVDAALHQLMAAARLPGGADVCPIAMNAALAFVEGQNRRTR